MLPDPAAESVIGIQRHVDLGFAVEFKDAGDPVLVVVNIAIAVVVAGEVSGGIVCKSRLVDRKIAIRQVIDIIDLIAAASQVDGCAIAQIVHPESLVFCHLKPNQGRLCGLKNSISSIIGCGGSGVKRFYRPFFRVIFLCGTVWAS